MEPSDVVRVLRKLPFRVASLEIAAENGSYLESLIDSVYEAVRKDCEFCIREIELERGRRS